MKIAIEKNTLVSTLNKAMKAVSTKSLTPILEGVLLEAKDSVIYISGNNLDIGIQASTKCEVLKPGAIVVNARLLSDVVQKMPDEEIDITLNGSELTIEAGRSVNKIKALEANTFPALIPSDAKGGQIVEIDQKDLRTLINKTVFAVSLDENRAPMTGELIKIADGIMDIVATDGFRMAVRRAKTASDDFEAIVQGKTMADIGKILESGPMKIYKNGNVVMFEADDYFVMARTVDGQFLNYKRFIEGDDADITIQLMTAELKNAVESVIPFMPSGDMSKNPPMKVYVDRDKIRISYMSEIGQSVNDVMAQVTGDPCICGLNPKCVIDVIRAIDEKEIILVFRGKNKPIFIKPIDGDSFMYMLLPVLLPG